MIYNATTLSETTCEVTGMRDPSASFYYWLALGYAFLFILALTANLYVLVKLYHYPRRRIRDHILLLNLCAADLFVTVVYIPSEIYAYTIGRWYYDEICKIIAALKGLGIYVSSCTITSISLDRYLSIVHPLTVYQSNRRNKLLVIGSWFISAMACIPQLIIFKRLTNQKLCREMCGDTLTNAPVKRVAYNIVVAIFAYVAPLIITFYSYLRILYALQKRCDRRTFRFVKCYDGSDTYRYDINSSNYSLKPSIRKSYNHDRAKDGNRNMIKQSPRQEINAHNMKTIIRAKLKTLKLTVLIVICFILCWTPYYCVVFFLLITDPRTNHEHLSNLNVDLTSNTTMDTVNYNNQSSLGERSLSIGMMLAVSNSVLDPLLYGCYLVRPTEWNCFGRKASRAETTILRRVPEIGADDKELKSTITRTNIKHCNHI